MNDRRSGGMRTRLLTCSAGVLWLVSYVLLARYGGLLIPAEWAGRVTLTQYLLLVHLVTMIAGLGLVLVGSTDSWAHAVLPLRPKSASSGSSTASPKTAFPPPHSWIAALLLGPLLYVVSHLGGMYAAFDLLLRDLAEKGAQAVQQQSGELGRVAQSDSLVWVVPFTLVVAPLSEELLFRGGLWAAVRVWFVDDESPESTRIPGIKPRGKLVRIGWSWLKTTGLPLLVTTGCFAAMHADMPGGMGRMRWVSALLLGLGCGAIRSWSGWLGPAVALHASYNLVSLCTLRGYLVLPSWPTWYALPTVLLPLAPAFALCAVLGLYWISARDRRRRAQ